MIDDLIAATLMLPVAINPKATLRVLTFNLYSGHVPEKGFTILRVIAIVSLFFIVADILVWILHKLAE